MAGHKLRKMKKSKFDGILNGKNEAIEVKLVCRFGTVFKDG